MVTIDPTDNIFCFRFREVALSNQQDLRNVPHDDDYWPFTVYATSLDLMKRFLLQHKFSEECLDDVSVLGNLALHEVFDDRNRMFLKEVQMYSNQTKQIYNVATTEDIIESVIGRIAGKLADTLSFGNTVIRSDMEFVTVLQNIMENLPYGYMVEHAIIQDMECVDIDRFPSLDEQYPSDGEDSSYAGIIEDLYADIIPDKPLPISLEGYASAFAEIVNAEEEE